MKNINIVFSDEEHKRLVKMKEYLAIKNWHDLILVCVKQIYENQNTEMQK